MNSQANERRSLLAANVPVESAVGAAIGAVIGATSVIWVHIPLLGLLALPGAICAFLTSMKPNGGLFGFGIGVPDFDLSLMPVFNAVFFGAFGLLIGSIVGKRRHKSRLRDNSRCLQCSYDLTGNTSGTCPECGTPIMQDHPR